MSLKLMYALLFTLATAAFADPFHRRTDPDDFDHSNVVSPLDGTARTSNDWVEVSQTSARTLIVSAGQRVELECEVLGKPPPTAAVWFKNSIPISQMMTETEEANMISGVGLGKLISRLVIECAEPQHAGIYQCRAAAGARARASSPSHLIVKGPAVPCPVVSKLIKMKPRISTWSPLVLENMNNDVVLPCTVTGHPRPRVMWLDETKTPVGGDSSDSRRKVTESGNLVIRRLRWEDMGGYTCVAENIHGRDTRLTFLYPMLNEG